jgi:hypothetical protein
MELVAHGVSADQQTSETSAQLEFREVWWAESVGIPSVGTTIRWARVQFREQAANLLLLFRRNRTGNAVDGYRPARDNTLSDTNVDAAGSATVLPAALHQTPDSAANAPNPANTHATLSGLQRWALLVALGLYSGVQYVFKALQWILLAPVAFLLLMIMGLLRLLALIPPLQTSLLAGASNLLSYIMLHWIAEAEVYTLNYTRSAGIRERFEHEMLEFLRDEYCERIVVIAHSMGTVIAYEGLTSILDQPEFGDSQEPLTFICLASALRRAWLMAAADPHRLRRVLPDRVRWLHFWARYDPVAAGPLGSYSLPPLARSSEAPTTDEPHSSEALRARLDTCQNVPVVNTDSTFTDHTTYWTNVSQVVLPIARELVAGHSALEREVEAHLPKRDDILLHRWRIAWRYLISLLAGVGAVYALLFVSVGPDLHLGNLLVNFLDSSTFLNAVIGALTNGLCGVQGCHISAPGPLNLLTLIKELIIGEIQLLVSFVGPLTSSLLLYASALLVGGIAMVLVGRLIAVPSPYSFATPATGRRSSRWTIFVWAAGFALFIVVSDAIAVFVSELMNTRIATIETMYEIAYSVFILAVLLSIVLWLLAVASAVRLQKWGWLALIVVITILFVPLRDEPERAALLMGITVCIGGLCRLAIRHQWRYLAIGFLLTFPLLAAAVISLPLGFASAGTSILSEALSLPSLAATPSLAVTGFCWGPLIYGIWADHLPLATDVNTAQNALLEI